MPQGIGYPAEWSAEQEEIMRRRRLADALRAQSTAPIQSAGNAPISWTQGLAKMAQAFGAKKLETDAADKQRLLVDRLRDERASTLNDAFSAMQGVPRVAPGAGDSWGLGNEGVEANPRSAMQILARSSDPVLQNAGTASLLKLMEPRQAKMQRVEIPDGKGGMRVGFVDINNANPMSTFTEAGTQGAKLQVAPSGEAYNPYQVEPGRVFNDPNKLMSVGPDGRPVTNQALVDVKKDIASVGPVPFDAKDLTPAQYRVHKLERAAVGAPRVSVNSMQEREEAKAVGKAMGEAFNDIQKSGGDARAKINRYDRLVQLLDGVNTGKLTPAGTEIAAWADSFGIKIDPKLGNKQAVRALANEIALTLRNPSGGAGMPGALSDSDRKFLVSMTPNLANTPEGNRLLIDTAMRLAKRDIDVAKIAREYRQKRGQMDEGFYEELHRFSESNPLFQSQTPIVDKRSVPFQAQTPSTDSRFTSRQENERGGRRDIGSVQERRVPVGY